MDKIDDILTYIPQRYPFVLIDKIHDITDEGLSSTFKIDPNHVMVDKSHLTEGGMLENMAQSAAAFAGFQYRSKGKNVPVGFIAGMKKIVIHGNPETGSEITTKIKITNDLMNIQVVEGEVNNEQGETLATCELRIFINKESNA